jgi:hypothetical protein
VLKYISTRGLKDFLHDNGNQDGRLKALEQNVGKRFENGVRDEENRQCSIVPSGGHVMKIFLQSDDLGIADIGPIEKCEKVQNAEL